MPVQSLTCVFQPENMKGRRCALICRNCQHTRRNFCQRRESAGKCFKEHHMELAARLLLETSLSIAEIGQRIGYESQSRFTSAFKTYF